MADYMTVKEAAKEWGITDRQVSGMCLSGRIQGAVKNGRNWLIPANAEKPVDQRIKSGNYVKTAKPTISLCQSESLIIVWHPQVTTTLIKR